jgi:hypothetical protein
MRLVKMKDAESNGIISGLGKCSQTTSISLSKNKKRKKEDCEIIFV